MEPHSLVGGMGEGSWSNWGLACGLKDQRLMARPPARAGGRSGLLTAGKSGKSNGYSLPFPKGYLPTSPARPAGGRAVTSVTRRGPQARYSERSTASPPHNPTREGGSGGGTSSPGGSFPHFFPRNGAPAGQAKFLAVPTAPGKTHHRLPRQTRRKNQTPCAGIQTYTGGFIIVTV